MITEELIKGLAEYGLGIVKKEDCYSLVELATGEWYEDMSIHYIYRLVNNWDNFHKRI